MTSPDPQNLSDMPSDSHCERCVNPVSDDDPPSQDVFSAKDRGAKEDKPQSQNQSFFASPPQILTSSTSSISSTSIYPTIDSAKLPVSLVFKRTCYKCGNLGHHADECESEERLCYNCKQPGHESSHCPNDRSAESKQCYFCKEMGHIQSSCPRYKTLRRERRYTPHTSPIPSQHIPSSGQILYYSQLRSQLPHQTLHSLNHSSIQCQYQQPQFYFPPTSMHRYSQGYPSPPPPPIQHGGGPPQMYYPQGMMSRGVYIEQAQEHHHGNQLMFMRGYRPLGSGLSMCYACGKQGHESRDCIYR